MGSNQGRYWGFFWPLSLMGVVVFAGRLAQNRVLLGYEEGVAELAAFFMALAFFGPFRAVLIFLPQMSNVMVKGPRSARSCLAFVSLLVLALAAPLALVGWTPLGELVVPLIYRVKPDRVTLILRYLRFFTPLLVVDGLARFLAGLLVQAERTGVVTALRALYTAILIGMLTLGLRLEWAPVATLSLSFIVPATVNMIISGLCVLRLHDYKAEEEDRSLALRETAGFYLPLVGTTVMFALSRPIIYSLLSGTELDGIGGETLVAAVGLAFSFNMLFQITINQYRNLMVTFGSKDPEGLRRFMAKVTVAVTVTMLAIVASPAIVWFLRDLQNAAGDTLRLARQAAWVMCLTPLVVTFRNYFHGMAMAHRRTGSMIVGGLARNGSILGVASALVAAGWYNHLTGAGMLVLGFGAEAAAVCAVTRGWRNEIGADDSGR